jgi:hypothetical protein
MLSAEYLVQSRLACTVTEWIMRHSEKAHLAGRIGTEKRASVRQSTPLLCRRVVDVVSARRRFRDGRIPENNLSQSVRL